MDTGTTVTQIGKYQILGVLGVGGMGVVYRGLDNAVGREVAIKTITEANEELRHRFMLEARSGILNHPNIVTVYDFGEQDGNPYIVMEYVPGDSLENMLNAGRQFSLIEKLEIIRQLCSGLGYAHQKGVIHRDIKPANIMVMPDGNIKIVDFGVARLENRSGHTQAGMVIGTFHYISPERLLGKSADGRADIWSAGIILYLLLTGRLPFPGDDPATLHRVVREPHEPVSSLVPGCPTAIDHLLNRALAKDPIDRYETSEEMAADIEAVNDGLKQEHVAEALGNVKIQMEREQWSAVRPVLLDLQRLNPQNTEVKKLLREVQEKVSRQQKTVQLKQLLIEADEAVLAQHYAEALEIYTQAATLDRDNPELAQKIENARSLKEKAEKVASLLEQSRDARKRSDFGTAGELIERALQLDERNTDLRNERARIVQEAERATRERARRQYSDAARGQLAARQYTEAIQSLRSALEIDPTDAETQQLFQEAVDRQEEGRRRKIIEQIGSEISESITAGEFARALALIQRAQQRLPGEPVLLQLKADAEAGQRQQAAKKLVEKTTLDVYSLLATSPHQALTAVHQALEQMPGEPQLIALEEKVVGQVKKLSAEETKNQYLQRAQAAIDAKQFDQALQVLDSAAIECGDSSDIASLLKYAQEQKRKVDLGQAAAKATKDAQALIAAGNLEVAIAILQPAASATGDATVEQLLRQTTASLTELGRRVDAVVSRAQTLSQTDTEQALNLLSNQPQEIQQNARVRELRERLDAGKERERRERTINEAIRDAVAALQQRELAKVLVGLEAARRSCGDSPQLTAAIAEYTSKRTQSANGLLAATLESATQAMQRNEQARAADELGRVAFAVEFADAGLQANWTNLSKAAGSPVAEKQAAWTQVTPMQPAAVPATVPVAAAKKSGGLLAPLIAVVVVLLLAAAGAGYWFFLRPAPAVPVGVLQLNATPFAEVVDVTSDKGKAIPLPDGDHWTPLRIEDVPIGKYNVDFKGSDGSTQSQQCNVEQSAQVCSAELKPIDDNAIEQIIGGAK
jgi:eukaryotic-like serine/threonine-protein kinase